MYIKKKMINYLRDIGSVIYLCFKKIYLFFTAPTNIDRACIATGLIVGCYCVQSQVIHIGVHLRYIICRVDFANEKLISLGFNKDILVGDSSPLFEIYPFKVTLEKMHWFHKYWPFKFARPDEVTYVVSSSEELIKASNTLQDVPFSGLKINFSITGGDFYENVRIIKELLSIDLLNTMLKVESLNSAWNGGLLILIILWGVIIFANLLTHDILFTKSNSPILRSFRVLGHRLNRQNERIFVLLIILLIIILAYMIGFFFGRVLVPFITHAKAEGSD